MTRPITRRHLRKPGTVGIEVRDGYTGTMPITELWVRYVLRGESLRTIARHAGTSYENIKQRCHRHGIPLRGRGGANRRRVER